MSLFMAVNADSGYEQELSDCREKFHNYRTKALRAFKPMVKEEQVSAPPCTRCEKKFKDFRAKVSSLERRSDAMIAGELLISY